MIFSFEANLAKLALHHVGNPILDEGYSLSDQELNIDDELKKSLLMQYFLSPFNKTVEIFNFYHPSGDLKLNDLYYLCKSLFENTDNFIETSHVITQTLHTASNHPKIKSGDLYVVLFENIQIEGELLPAIGIFKSESKEAYLKVNAAIGSMDVNYEQDAVNINKLDKGCLIFNIDADKGYKVAVIDNSGKADSSFWKDEFLQLKVRNDHFNQTNNTLSIYKNFVTQKLDDEFEMSNSDKIDLLNRGIKYFKEKESFDIDEFVGEVIGNEQAVESFKNFKNQYEEEFETPIADSFEISDNAVKKQARAFKSIIKLDKNFQLHVAGDKSLIERGFDEEKSLNYYKVYFKQESFS
jgi:hypothetical protein